MLALSMYINPYDSIVCVMKNKEDIKKIKSMKLLRTNIKILNEPTENYKLLNNKTTYYVCKNHNCYPPTNDINKFYK